MNEKTGHTPGPWTKQGPAVCEGARILGKDGFLVAVARAAGGPTRIAMANRERIVACVNACSGINPKAVRDLLEACRATLEYLRERDGRTNEQNPIRALLRDAIGRAEGR